MSSTEVPTENEGSALQLLVLCNGIPLTDIVQVSRINISQILNRVSEAVIQIQSASCDQVFQRGSDISMYASWGNNPQQMIYFGKIQSYEMGITDNTGFAYILYCRQLLSDVEVVTPDLTRPPVLTLTCGDTMRSFTGRYYGTQSTSRTCTVSCAGTAVPVPGTMIELANVGKDFSGTALVTELSHIIAEGDWVSTLVTGDAVNYQTKFGKQKGLQMATVKKLTGDPEQKGRILVDIITGEEECFSVWAYYA
ncbi:MAG: type secretion protein Vgr, partial [Chitinophagaceae bacterium]|nr:type secretion protein Vgr [Chitinophagaceae bacterium]